MLSVPNVGKGAVASHRTPFTAVFYIPETGRFGFSYAFEGHQPHDVITSWVTLQDAIDLCDPHPEHIRKETRDDANRLPISRGYNEGSGICCMTPYTSAEFAAHSAGAVS